MSDTNINAFEAEVQEAEKALAQAQSNVDKAKQRLADKKAELGIEEPVAELEADTDEEPTDSPDKGVVGEVDPIPTAPELPQAGDVVTPTEPTKIEVTSDES